MVDYEGNPWSYRIYGNGWTEEPLRRAFGFVVERGLAQELKAWNGCFNIRPMKGGSRQTSMHAWAVANDFNADTNPFGRRLITDFSPEFVRCFADAGWEWGGLGDPNFDAMHFQLAWTRDWRGSSNPLAPVPWVA